jgi:hypothetical protein
MKKMLALVYLFLATIVLSSSTVFAQPYGKGVYNADVPYGSQTYLSIATDGDVVMPITPLESGVSTSANSVVTVVSTDVVGYKLYIRALNTANMTNQTAVLPPSGNSSLAPLAINTWGYNTNQSNDYIGISTSDTLIKNTLGPVKAGEQTTIKYGLYIDLRAGAGEFRAGVVYTAVPQTD